MEFLSYGGTMGGVPQATRDRGNPRGMNLIRGIPSSTAASLATSSIYQAHISAALPSGF